MATSTLCTSQWKLRFLLFPRNVPWQWRNRMDRHCNRPCYTAELRPLPKRKVHGRGQPEQNLHGMPQRMVPNQNQQTILPSLQCRNIYRPVEHNRMPTLSTKHLYQHHRIVRRLYHVRSLPNRQSLGPRCLVVFSMRPGPIHVTPKRGWFLHHQNLHHLPGRLDQRVRGNEMRRMHPRKICQWACL